MLRHVFVIVVVLSAVHAFAQDPTASPAPSPALPAPTADEIKRVLDYQESGKDRGPVLLELVPCLKVDLTKGSPTQYNCVEPITAPIKKGTTVNAWTAFFCPKGGSYDDLSIQFLHENQVRQTADLKVEGFSRTRSFRSHQFTKSGKWVIKVLRGDKELGSAQVVVDP
jgi:hypothetical protein